MASSSESTDYIEWTDYFMGIALLAAKRSKDPSTQVGACIVKEGEKIIGIGYNGMPTKCRDHVFGWEKNEGTLQNKYLYVCHAEMNAIINKNTADVKQCSIYVSLFPCNECAKFIIQSEIKEVIYLSDKYSEEISTQAAKKMFDEAGVKYWEHERKREKIMIDFTKDCPNTE